MKNIIMPKLSDTMTEGLLGSWLKAIGDTITRGDIIAEVETDKATMGLEAFDNGVLLAQKVKAGETVPVGAVLGVIGNRDELQAEAIAPTDEETDKTETVAAVTKPAEAASEPVIARAAAPTSEKASPVVRRRARELGIDLETIRGSGSGGRVLLEDLAPVPKEQPVTIQAATVTTPEQTDAADHQDAEALPLSRMREAIARTVSLSWRNIPHFAVTMDIRMDHAAEVRRELKGNGKPVSINELVMKGVALTLRKCPMVNASYLDGSIVLHQEVHIGVMVKVTDGLLAPVIRSCQSLSLTELAAKSRELIQRARNATITEAELSGGTFSVSNLGAYGVKQFTAIILPPQVAILAVGAITERLVPGKGGPVAAQIMRVTLSADHRVLDGVAAAEFLLELKQVLENPVRLLL